MLVGEDSADAKTQNKVLAARRARHRCPPANKYTLVPSWMTQHINRTVSRYLCQQRSAGQRTEKCNANGVVHRASEVTAKLNRLQAGAQTCERLRPAQSPLA